jgi:CrcB protein
MALRNLTPGNPLIDTWRIDPTVYIVNKYLRPFLSETKVRSMQTFLIISLGAVLGANSRYWLGGWAVERFGTSFPYGNLIINLSGSFILGFFMTLITGRFLVDPQWRLLVAIGFLGSYTTFSSYTYESVSLILNGQLWLGLLNLLGSSLLGGMAVLLGIWLGRLI